MMMQTTSRSILNIAHRGARAYAPENTLVAFAKAKTLGSEMFEMDVRLTKDGEVVVYHDENLMRCTDALDRFPGKNSYKLADFTYKELTQLDAGSWYVAQLALTSADRQPFLHSLTDAEIAEYVTPSQRKYYASGDIKIPTLTETLCLAKELELMVNIELKSEAPSDTILVSKVVASVEAMNLNDSILISSFTHDLLRLVRHHSKNIATAILNDKPIKAPLTYLRKLKVNAYNLGCFHDFNTTGFDSPSGKRYLAHLYKVCHAGFGVNIWTCNDPDEMQALLNGGVTGLISDYPNRVREKVMAFSKNR